MVVSAARPLITAQGYQQLTLTLVPSLLLNTHIRAHSFIIPLCVPKCVFFNEPEVVGIKAVALCGSQMSKGHLVQDRSDTCCLASMSLYRMMFAELHTLIFAELHTLIFGFNYETSIMFVSVPTIAILVTFKGAYL